MGRVRRGRPIVVRQVRHEWDGRDLPRHFVGGDLLLSHLAAVFSSVFPEGEAFFVRSVRHYRSTIVDPELAERVTGFIGQEMVHAREHRRLDEHLARLGYPVRHLDRRAHWGLRIVEAALPPSVLLAATAALEHVTATLADAILGSDEVRALFLDDEVRDLVVWHAVEEAEHRSVAFDVYQEVCGKEWLRTWTLRVVMVTSGLDMGSALVTSLLCDPDGRSARKVRESLQAMRTSPFAGLGLGGKLMAYTRRGFHPDDGAPTELVDRWAATLRA
ncbi:MAG: metal-dependent hydrolase [Acidimicrobiales bacterium]